MKSKCSSSGMAKCSLPRPGLETLSSDASKIHTPNLERQQPTFENDLPFAKQWLDRQELKMCGEVGKIKCSSSADPQTPVQSFDGLPYAKQWLAHQSVNHFISSVDAKVEDVWLNDEEYTETTLRMTGGPADKSSENSGRSMPSHRVSAVNKTLRQESASRSPYYSIAAFAAKLSASTEDALESQRRQSVAGETPDSTQSVLGAGAIENVPGYRNNKMHALLLRNQQLEQMLCQARDEKERLLQEKEALAEEKHELQKRISDREKEVENLTNFGLEAATPSIPRLVLPAEKRPTSPEGQAPISLSPRKQLKHYAQPADKRPTSPEGAAPISLSPRRQHKHASASCAPSGQRPHGMPRRPGMPPPRPSTSATPDATPDAATPRPVLHPVPPGLPRPPNLPSPCISPRGVGADAKTPRNGSGRGSGGERWVSDASTSSPPPRQGGSICPLGLPICSSVGACVCGAWEAELQHAQAEVVGEKARCARLQEQLQDLQRKYEERKQAAQERCSALQKRGDALQLRVEELQHRCNTLQRECGSLQEDLDHQCKLSDTLAQMLALAESRAASESIADIESSFPLREKNTKAMLTTAVGNLREALQDGVLDMPELEQRILQLEALLDDPFLAAEQTENQMRAAGRRAASLLQEGSLNSPETATNGNFAATTTDKALPQTEPEISYSRRTRHRELDGDNRGQHPEDAKLGGTLDSTPPTPYHHFTYI